MSKLFHGCFVFFATLSVAAGAAIHGGQAWAAPHFSRVIEDLPLPEGFQENGTPAIFDAPEGRLIATSGECRCAPAAIARFYAQTLPALGWRATGDGQHYTRGGERLSIELVQRPARNPRDSGVSRIRFRLLGPRAAAELTE